MMKAVAISDYGDPDNVMTISDMPKPLLKRGSKKTLIRVLAVSPTPGIGIIAISRYYYI